MERFLWISFAGALGTGTRYLVGLWTAARFGETFPYGTLVVNLAGCFLIALSSETTLAFTSLSASARSAWTIGFLGGLTTYSSFNYETTKLFASGARGAALTNLCITMIGCMLAGMLGASLARRLLSG